MILSREAARRCGLTTASLANLRSRGEGPPGWVRLSKTTIAYPEETVSAYVAERAARAAETLAAARAGAARAREARNERRAAEGRQ